MYLLIESIAAILTLFSVFKAAEKNLNTWWLGILSCFFYIIIYIKIQAYGLVLFQIICIVQSMIGVYEWKNLKISKTSFKDWIIASLSIPLTFCIYFSNKQIQSLDLIITVLSIAANHLLVKGKRESWILWLIVNILSMYLFISTGNIISSALYAFLINFSIYALVTWKIK